MEDLMEEKANPIAAKKKSRKKKGKAVDHLDSGDPKHHLVHVHVNVVNNSEAGGSKGKKEGNDADGALRRLRGW